MSPPDSTDRSFPAASVMSPAPVSVEPDLQVERTDRVDCGVHGDRPGLRVADDDLARGDHLSMASETAKAVFWNVPSEMAVPGVAGWKVDDRAGRIHRGGLFKQKPLVGLQSGHRHPR